MRAMRAWQGLTQTFCALRVVVQTKRLASQLSSLSVVRIEGASTGFLETYLCLHDVYIDRFFRPQPPSACPPFFLGSGQALKLVSE